MLSTKVWKKAAVEWVYHFLAAIVPSHKHFHGHILIADSMTIKDPKQKFYEKYFHHLWVCIHYYWKIWWENNFEGCKISQLWVEFCIKKRKEIDCDHAVARILQGSCKDHAVARILWDLLLLHIKCILGGKDNVIIQI